MIGAAGAWQELSAELEEAASGYASELASLTGTWRGPSSMTMAQAFEPYLVWLRATAAQCQEIAASVETVTAAFELTHGTVVHPVRRRSQPGAVGALAGHQLLRDQHSGHRRNRSRVQRHVGKQLDGDVSLRRDRR